MWEWVHSAAELPPEKIIHSYQDIEEPDNRKSPGTYITLTAFDDADTMGMTEEQFTDPDSGVPFQVDDWVIDGKIEVWGQDARQLAFNLRGKLFLPSYYIHLTKNDIDADLGGPQFIPGKKSEGWEERVEIPVRFTLKTETIDDGSGSPDNPETVAWFDKLGYSMPDLDHPILDKIITQSGDE